MKNSIPSIKNMLSILISIVLILVAIGVVYATLRRTLALENTDGYFANVAKMRIEKGLGVSSIEYSLDGFPYTILIIPLILIPMIYLINKYIIRIKFKTNLINSVIVFVCVLFTIVFSVLYYYNNYGKTLMAQYEALGPNKYIPEPAIVEPPTKETV